MFAPQETTTTYLSNNGKQILVLNSTIFEHTNKGFDGTRGWFNEIYLNKNKISSKELVNIINIIGHEHHFAVGQGNFSSELIEFASWNSIGIVKNIPMVDYLRPEDNK